MPTGILAGPVTCAVNIAASPKTAIRPFPSRFTPPWVQPAAACRGVRLSISQGISGMKTTAPGPRSSSGVNPPAGKADPTKLVTESTPSSAPPPSGPSASVPRARLNTMLPGKPVSADAKPFSRLTPNASPRSRTAAGKGMWSAMSRSAPPRSTQLLSARISRLLNAYTTGSGPSAFAMTSTPTPARAESSSSPDSARTRNPSPSMSRANGLKAALGRMKVGVAAVDEDHRSAPRRESRCSHSGPEQRVRLLLGGRRGGTAGPERQRSELRQRMHMYSPSSAMTSAGERVHE